MNCKQAHKAIEETVNQRRQPDGDLASHIAQCPECRAAWERAAALHTMVAEATAPPPVPDAVSRALARALAKPRPVSFAKWHIAWAAMAVAAFLFGFSIRKAETIEKIVRVPVYREKIVRIKVPEVRVKTVEKIVKVPVYRTRTIRVPAPSVGAFSERDAVASSSLVVGAASSRDASGRPDNLVGPEPAPRRPDTLVGPKPEQPGLIVQTLPTPAPMPETTFTETTRLAGLAEDETEG